MLYLKLLLFFNFSLLIFQYSSCFIQRDKRLLVEYRQNVCQASGSNINYPLIKLSKLELKKLKLDLNLDGDQEKYITEIIFEINEEWKHKSFIFQYLKTLVVT